VLKEGGRLFICHTSSRSEINQVHCQIPALANDIIPVESEMKSLLERAQFTNIRIADDSNSYLATAQKKPQL
jgi:hypothetical protein